MTTCQICGATKHTLCYEDTHLFNHRHPTEICDACLFQHIAYHYPNSPSYWLLLYHDLDYHCNLTPLEALIQLPPRSITQRLAEIPFTLSYWASPKGYLK